jgi:hypothetical protein
MAMYKSTATCHHEAGLRRIPCVDRGDICRLCTGSRCRRSSQYVNRYIVKHAGEGLYTYLAGLHGNSISPLQARNFPANADHDPGRLMPQNHWILYPVISNMAVFLLNGTYQIE